MRIAIDHLRIEAYLGEDGLDPFLAFALGMPNTVCRHAFHDDFAYHHAWIKSGVGILKNDLQAPPVGMQSTPVQDSQILAVHEDTAGGWPDELQEGFA